MFLGFRIPATFDSFEKLNFKGFSGPGTPPRPHADDDDDDDDEDDDDDGPGIPENEHERVMRPFYKLDKSRKLNDGSVGLGLSIVQDIINSHGGTVQLENKKKGLRVKLQFPI